MLRYSELRENIEIQPLKDDNNEQAYVTHYLHNLGNHITNYFKEPAVEYLTKFNYSKQEKLNFEWDIPFPTPKNPKFKFIDLFAGIGGMRLAYQKIGGKCVFSSEYNKFAKVTYEANFGEVPFGDITRINENSIPDHDVLLAGFPCQPFSIAGVSKKISLGRKHGFLDETQGTLFFDIGRILKGMSNSTWFRFSDITMIPKYEGCGDGMDSTGPFLNTHILNAAIKRLPLQSLTQNDE